MRTRKSSIGPLFMTALLAVATTACNGDDENAGAAGQISIPRSGMREGMDELLQGDPENGNPLEGTPPVSGGNGGAVGGSDSGSPSSSFACPALVRSPDSDPFLDDGATPKQCYQCAAASCVGSSNPMVCYRATCSACKAAKSDGSADQNEVNACASCAWKAFFDPQGFADDPNCNGQASN